MIRFSEAFPAIVGEQKEFLFKISIIKRLVWTRNTWSPAYHCLERRFWRCPASSCPGLHWNWDEGTNPEMLIDPSGVDKGKMKEMPCEQ